MGRRTREKTRWAFYGLIALLCVACGNDPVDLTHYKKLPFKYIIDSDFPEEYRGGVHAGARLWDELAVEQVFKYSGIRDYLVDSRVYNRDNYGKNVIHATNELYQTYDEEKGKMVDTNYAGVAHVTGGKENKILDCDIYLFDFQKNFVDGRDDHNYEGRTMRLVTLIAHEMGHCLGIYHSADAADTMYPTQHLHADAVGWDNLNLSPNDTTEFYNRYPKLTPFKESWWTQFLKLSHEPHTEQIECEWHESDRLWSASFRTDDPQR